MRDLKPQAQFRFFGSAALVIGYAAWFTKNPRKLDDKKSAFPALRDYAALVIGYAAWFTKNLWTKKLRLGVVLNYAYPYDKKSALICVICGQKKMCQSPIDSVDFQLTPSIFDSCQFAKIG